MVHKATGCTSASVARSKNMRGESLIRLGVLVAFFLWGFGVFGGLHGTVRAAGCVETVTAHVTAVESLPPLVQKRMETTVAAIAAQLLGGRHLDEVQVSAAQDAAVIHEVFDKVLVGYSVAQVDVFPGEETRVEVRLLPWADVIRSVTVETTVEGMPPEIEVLVRRDLAAVETVFEESLLGLPVAASDWTNGVLKRSLNEYLAAHLPEFRGDFDVIPGALTRVSLTVYPRLPVVRRIDLSMRSDSIPNFTLLNHRRRMEERVNHLIGVPVGFVRRHAGDFTAAFAAELDSLPDFRALSLQTQVTLPRIDETVDVMSRSDTEKYLIRLEGWADITRRHNENHNVVFRFHAGYRPTRRDEVFLETDFAPQAVVWDGKVGYVRHFTPSTRGILRYDMKGRRFILGGEQQSTDRWLLRYEYRWSDQKGEAAIRYRMHDFLSLEYVFDKDDSWLRLIGNF